LILNPGVDVNASETLRVIARDFEESVNITELVVTSGDISSGLIVQDSILDIHYLDLVDFPWYESTIDSGAMAMKMMLDFLMWNSTTHPSGPPDTYDEMTIYNTYSGGNHINASELAFGINDIIDDHTLGWIYGYWMAPNGYIDVEDALRNICVWVDYPVDYYNDYRQVDVPKPGHPNHVPVAIPLDGNYNHWVSVRGIHSDHNAWNYTGPLSVYGFWINDPQSGGIGSNTYVTIDKFTSDYYDLIRVFGDRYYNKFVTVTDPPNIDVNLPENSDEIILKHSQQKFTKIESFLIKNALKFKSNHLFSDRIVISTAYEEAENILKYSNFASDFTSAIVNEKIICGSHECFVKFTTRNNQFIVTIGTDKGELRQIQ